MATFGPQAASGASDSAAIGTLTWGTTSNVTASDDSRSVTTAGAEGAITHYLLITYDTSSLPSFSSLDGLQPLVEGSRVGTGGVANEYRIRIVKNGTVSTTELGSGASLGTSDGNVTYGGVSNLCGETWANGDTIGLAVSYTIPGGEVGVDETSARVDYSSLTVTYTAGGAAGQPTRRRFGLSRFFNGGFPLGVSGVQYFRNLILPQRRLILPGLFTV